jgi:hypothetical protein
MDIEFEVFTKSMKNRKNTRLDTEIWVLVGKCTFYDYWNCPECNINELFVVFYNFP